MQKLKSILSVVTVFAGVGYEIYLIKEGAKAATFF
jgi:hypothetical protein